LLPDCTELTLFDADFTGPGVTRIIGDAKPPAIGSIPQDDRPK